MGLGPRMEALASRLVEKFGADATISRSTGGTYNPVTFVTTGATVTSDTTKAVVEEYRAHEVDGETIRYGDKKILIPLSDLTNLSAPVPNDTISILGATYRIINVEGVSSGDAIVAYSVQARK